MKHSVNIYINIINTYINIINVLYINLISSEDLYLSDFLWGFIKSDFLISPVVLAVHFWPVPKDNTISEGYRSPHQAYVGVYLTVSPT